MSKPSWPSSVEPSTQNLHHLHGCLASYGCFTTLKGCIWVHNVIMHDETDSKSPETWTMPMHRSWQLLLFHTSHIHLTTQHLLTADARVSESALVNVSRLLGQKRRERLSPSGWELQCCLALVSGLSKEALKQSSFLRDTWLSRACLWTTCLSSSSSSDISRHPSWPRTRCKSAVSFSGALMHDRQDPGPNGPS